MSITLSRMTTSRVTALLLLTTAFLASDVRSSSLHVAEGLRSGKFVRFGSPVEVLSDVLDEVHDPIAQEMGREEERRNAGSQLYRYPGNATNENRSPSREENPGKFELVTSASGQFTLPFKSVPPAAGTVPAAENGVVFYGGQHYKYRRPSDDPSDDGNRTGEVKIFWSSVTDAIESLPFLPVQVNVPDMITAMAQFISSSIPIINRFTNPNNPRLPGTGMMAMPPSGDGNEIAADYSEESRYRETEDRNFKGGNVGRKSGKKRKSHRRKSSKSKRKSGKESSASRGIVKRPFLRRTTEVPADDTKIWHAASGNEAGTVIKNMPITRRKFLVRDREVFNFKNSDLRNSPIMILNIPSRPMTYYKTKVRQELGDAASDGTRLVNDVSAGTAKNVVKTGNGARGHEHRRENSKKPPLAAKRARTPTKQAKEAAKDTKKN